MQFENHYLENPIGPIGTRNYKPIGPIGDHKRQVRRSVDKMLYEHKDLILPDYTKWFAKQFYRMDPEVVSRCASEAKADGVNPQRLFAFLIKKRSV